ncbi:DUF4245 domain-containing protein [Mycobacterium shigaense]|uniref:Uncharacterized protein n=1 Tax=Mycobacterium shigaense TaxID=722731 RepID=A0A1Z4EM93_9MYCO|nr:DUF4245 domain-containing protein [Mycobacterium shigaense]PRI12867.1 hypothetical protein B2J96_22500 [Mycobacterium shigaense]BAX94051.1 hypothetical protein MSG_03925 [Mycobacterium shigaense]
MTEEPQPNADAAGEPTPVARPAKSRLLQDGRDMFWSLVPLLIGCVVLAGLVGMCSFEPGGSTHGTIPSYDAPAALQADAQVLGFPIRLPELPGGWQANSGGRGSIQNGRTADGQRVTATTSNVGYISPTGMYLSLTQSNADEDKLVGSIHPSAYPTGTVDVAGIAWVVYRGAGQSGADTEPVWTARLSAASGATQIAITGAGNTEQFRTLALATQSQRPLASR